IALGRYELREGSMPRPGSDEWKEWEAVLDRAWQGLLAEWRALDPDTEGLAFLQMNSRRDILSLWMRVRLAAGDADAETDCIARYLEVEALGSTARRLGQPAVTLAEVVRDLAPPNGAIVVFLPAATGSHALWLTNSSVRVFRLPAEGPLRQRVFDLRRIAFSQDDVVDEADLRRKAQLIASTLLQEDLRALLARVQTLLVAGHELLHGLPVELLPIDEPEHWLGLRHAVAYEPSITLAMHMLHREPRTAEAKAVMLAATQVGSQDAERWQHGPIDVSHSSLRAALAAVREDQVDIRRDATPADLRPRLGPPDLLAIVAHGIFDGSLPCPGGLLLGPDTQRGTGAVFAADLASVPLPRIAFLGVCGATRGSLRLGEDGGHRFPGVLLAGGSDTVVASDGDVRLDEVLAMLQHFTNGLMAGDDAAQALLQARQEMAKTHRHPRAWAGLHLEGLPGTRVHWRRAQPATVWPWGVGVLLGIAAATFAWWRRRSGQRNNQGFGGNGGFGGTGGGGGKSGGSSSPPGTPEEMVVEIERARRK
ncbi:MAG: CHAT domain-containing protein, partial [Planctomycetota bacterium]